MIGSPLLRFVAAGNAQTVPDFYSRNVKKKSEKEEKKNARTERISLSGRFCWSL